MLVFAAVAPGGEEAVELPAGGPSPTMVRRVADELLQRIPAAGFRLARRYTFVNALAGEVTAGVLAALLADPRVLRVDLDQGGTGTLTEALPLAEVTDFKANGYDGQGVVAAVLDSGYDSDHADLSDDLVGESCFCSGGGGCCPGGGSTGSGTGSAEDDHGHGTNVTGIITSKGVVAPEGGAPEVEIVAVKVLDSNNAFCCSSDVIAGMDWVLANRPDVDLVNMSLGTSARYAGNCDNANAFTMAYAAAVNALRTRGVPVFVSSGNDASATEMRAPACVAAAISVGAVYDTDIGPANWGICSDPATAADVVTCWTNSNSTTDIFAPGCWTTAPGLGGGTSTYAGTSQASPTVASCAALLLDKAPNLTPDQIEEALESSTTLVTDPKNGLSFPRLDCLKAGEQCIAPLVNDVSTMSTVMGSVDESACQKIIAGPYPIGPTGVVSFLAGEVVELRNDFSVAAGGEVEIEINGLLVPSP